MRPIRVGCVYPAPCTSSVLGLDEKKLLKDQTQDHDHHLSWVMGSPQPLALPFRPLKVPLLWQQSLLTCGILLMGH